MRSQIISGQRTSGEKQRTVLGDARHLPVTDGNERLFLDLPSHFRGEKLPIHGERPPRRDSCSVGRLHHFRAEVAHLFLQ